jgi:hypothetical protein
MMIRGNLLLQMVFMTIYVGYQITYCAKMMMNYYQQIGQLKNS